MTEREFIRQNKEKWQALESQLGDRRRDPDVLVDLFTKVSGDLSYARTFFPNRSVRIYLNSLTQRVFDTIGKRKKRVGIHTFQDFFRHTLPQEIIASKNAFFLSAGLFILAVVIGVLSTAFDTDFPALILGQDYIDMTLENISNGDPMAVYKDEGMVDMFFRITINNIKVSMLAFVLGLTGTLGTIVILIQNGIMLGTFQYFFYQKGLLMTSFLTIWIHGTIEISSIIIAGAAGIILGNSILFPKTHSRMVSLQLGAYRALRILLGTVPLFIAAGLLESFVTRHTEWPIIVKAGIIGLSALLIAYMWIIYPWRYSKSQYSKEDILLDISPSQDVELEHQGVSRLSTITTRALALIRGHFGWVFVYGFLPAWSLILVGTWFYYKLVSDDLTLSSSLTSYEHGGWQMYVLYSVAISYLIAICTIRIEQFHNSVNSVLGFFRFNGLRILLSASMLWALVYFLPDSWWLLAVALLPAHFFLSWASDIGNQQKSLIAKFTYYLSHSYKSWGQYLIIIVVIWIFSLIMSSLIFSQGSGLLTNFLTWHDFGLQGGYNSYWLVNALIALLPLFLILIGTYISVFLYYAVENRHYAADLNRRLEEFGKVV